jgi:hypothetical protein
VLSDGETYSEIRDGDKSALMLPSREGTEILDEGGDPGTFTRQHVIQKVSIAVLLREYLLKHGRK